MRRLAAPLERLKVRLVGVRTVLDGGLLPSGGWLMQPGNFLAFVAVLMAGLFAITGFGFPALGGDDSERLVFSQTFQWGYQLTDPPLYSWLLVVTAKLWAPSLVAAATLKFALLAAFYVAYWRLAHWTLLDPRLAAATALAPLAIFALGWEAVAGLSQTVLVALLYVLTALALLRLDQAARTRDFVVLGIVFGLGPLATYGYGVFAAALFAAAAFDPLFRERLKDRRILLTIALAGVIAAPHFAWLAGAWLTGGAAPIAAETAPYWQRALEALMQAVRGGAGFLLPLLVLLPLLLPEGFHALPRNADDMGPTARCRRLFGRQQLLLIGIVAVGVMLLPPERLRTHHFFFFVLAPLWWSARASAAGASEAAFRRVAAIGAAAGLLALVGLGTTAALGPLTCGERCQRHVPYAELAGKLQGAGFDGGTVVAHGDTDSLAGNLRAALPAARVISVAHPGFVPPLRPDAQGDCLIVWPGTAGDGGARAGVETAKTLFGAEVPEGRQPATVAAPLAGIDGGDHALSFHLIDGGSGGCR